jgi:hypothetical protein
MKLDNPDLIPEFKIKVDRGKNIEDVTSFPIANAAVTDVNQ